MEAEPKLSEVLEAVMDGFARMNRHFDALEIKMERIANGGKRVITEDDKRNIHA